MKKVIISTILSFLMFQTVSFAWSYKKLTTKEKEILYTTYFTKENLPCDSSTSKFVMLKDQKLCAYIDSPSSMMYLLTDALKVLVDKNVKIPENGNGFEYLELVSGLKTYTKEYDYNEMVNYYNPEMFQWIFDNFYDKPDGKTLGINNKDIYDSFFKEIFREYARAYVGLQKSGDFDKKVKEYKEYLKKDPYSGVDFMMSFMDNLKLDIKSEPREYEDSTIIGRWLRRGIDGTEKVSWSSLRKTMEDYDKEWFKSIQN
ncbi:MAG: hypothetical protein AABZ74_00150 [Cyanobacteriota bacterium]